MKITKQQLQKLIKEEIANINENVGTDPLTSAIAILQNIQSDIDNNEYGSYAYRMEGWKLAVWDIRKRIQPALDELMSLKGRDTE